MIAAHSSLVAFVSKCSGKVGFRGGGGGEYLLVGVRGGRVRGGGCLFIGGSRIELFSVGREIRWMCSNLFYLVSYVGKR